MAKQRVINTHFWDDDFVMDLTPTEKLMYLYLLTNPLTDICGAYEITLKRIVFDTGLSKTNVTSALERFGQMGKIIYRDGWMIVRNFAKNQVKNPKVKLGIDRSLSHCPDWVKDSLSKPINGYDRESHSNSDFNSNPNSKEEAAKPAAVTNPVEARIWKDGVELLQRSGLSELSARSFLGKMVADYSAEWLGESIAAAQAKNSPDPKAYIIGILRNRKRPDVGKQTEPADKANCLVCCDTGTEIIYPDPSKAWVFEKRPCPNGCSQEAIAA